MKNVLVTGASGGIGWALVHELANNGYTVFAGARDIAKLPDTSGADNIVPLQLDITEAASVNKAVAVIDQQGGVDVLINNAGYGQMGALLDMPIEVLQKQFDVNVVAQLRLIQAVSVGMVERRQGKIVNIGSVSGITATPFAGAYCASKAALHLMSDSLRVELLPFGVDVVVVQPGAIVSGFGNQASESISLGGSESRYAAAEAGIKARATESQNSRSTPAADFAKTFCQRVMAESCPSVVRIGSGSTLLPALKRWLPDAVLDKILAKKFLLNKLN